MLRTYEKLGIPLEEQKALSGVAVDAVFDSVSVATNLPQEPGGRRGDLLLDLEAARASELLREYLGSVVPHTDNFYAALNAAVFTDGTFVYIP